MSSIIFIMPFYIQIGRDLLISGYSLRSFFLLRKNILPHLTSRGIPSFIHLLIMLVTSLINIPYDKVPCLYAYLMLGGASVLFLLNFLSSALVYLYQLFTSSAPSAVYIFSFSFFPSGSSALSCQYSSL